MEYRNLGKSGLMVSEFSLGSWVTFGNQVDKKTADECMTYAYDQGVNFFDNAEVYAHGKSEEVMGEILKEKGWSRDTFIVSSKAFWGGKGPNQRGLCRKHLVEACNAALKRLQVEYLDLFYCHRPDHTTPIEETVYTMHNLIQQGKILYWGTSEWSAQEIQAAIGFAKENHLIPPVMEQPQYNMIHRERFEGEYARLFQDYGLGTTIWSPLASGLLTGKYNDKFPEGTRLSDSDLSWLKEKMYTPEVLDQTRKISAFAEENGFTPVELSLLWCLKNENVSTVILGASKVEQLKENIAVLDRKEDFTDSIYTEIDELLGNKPELPSFR